MPYISKAKYEYEVTQHEKRAEQRRLARRKERSLKCRLGFHFPYNLTGYPMLEVPTRCLHCEEPIKESEAYLKWWQLIIIKITGFLKI